MRIIALSRVTFYFCYLHYCFLKTEHAVLFIDGSTSVCRDRFSIGVQSIVVKGNINKSFAVNFQVGKFVFVPVFDLSVYNN